MTLFDDTWLQILKASLLNIFATELFFLILAHPEYKMWIIQEPSMFELWNKLHFEEEESKFKFKIFGTIFVE
jgi:hypothetical protein